MSNQPTQFKDPNNPGGINPSFMAAPGPQAANTGVIGNIDNRNRSADFTPASSTGVTGPLTTLTMNLSSRYDAFRGLLGPDYDMRANLFLNTIEDVATNPSARGNLQPIFFGGDVSTTCSLLPTPVVRYLQEIKRRIQVGSPQDLNAASQAIQNINAMTGLTTGTLQSLQTVAADLYVNNPDGSLSYAPNAFENLIDLLGIDSTCKSALLGMNGANQSNIDRFSTFLPDKLALQKFLEATEESNRLSIVSPSVAASPQAAVPENVFYKRVGQPGKTFTLDANGNETEVQAGSAVYQQLTEANQCYGTGVIARNANECNNYFIKCLAGKDIQECKSFMENGKG